MSSKIIFQNTRPTGWPGPEGTEITVTARQEREAVLLEWQRSDRAAAGEAPESIGVTTNELRSIVDALEADE
jgi:hypothetical protein